ncbi:MAG: glycosyltransferase, partial [Patescibacteria group bacterium]|nr:glycosyltransferase [Patescibacteria group bacterium]
MKPTLTVILPVYNQQASVLAAVDSILNQTYSDFIFIIIDDASSDRSLEILQAAARKDQRIKLIINHHHLGLTKSLNKALRFVKTKYISRMDADDLALPTRFAKQTQFLESHPETMLLGTAAYLIDDTGKQIGLKRFPSDHQHLRSLILKYCPFIHPTWMFHRSLISEIGEYNPDFPFSQDYELALRIVSRFKTANLAEPLLKYRVDSSQAISLKNLKKQEYLALKARFLALINYGYPVAEAWKLIKPLLSFLVPVGIKKFVYRKFFWTTILIFSLISLSGCAKQTAPIPITAPEPSSTSPEAKYIGWPEYLSQTFGYQLKYRYDWTQLSVDPSTPNQAVFVNLLKDDPITKPHVSFIVSVDKANNQNLETYPEIVELKAQGYPPRKLTIADSPAVFIDN